MFGEEQCGFRTGRGCVDALFTMNNFEKRREQIDLIRSVKY
jgi:hypothetical protein